MDSEHGMGKRDARGRKRGKEEQEDSVKELDAGCLSSLKSGQRGQLKALDLRSSIRRKRIFQNFASICCTGIYESS